MKAKKIGAGKIKNWIETNNFLDSKKFGVSVSRLRYHPSIRNEAETSNKRAREECGGDGPFDEDGARMLCVVQGSIFKRCLLFFSPLPAADLRADAALSLSGL